LELQLDTTRSLRVTEKELHFGGGRADELSVDARAQYFRAVHEPLLIVGAQSSF
jgi:hypothetical protein